MHRIDGPGATEDNRFIEGSPTLGIPPTMVTADWANAVQEEVVAVIAGAGLVLNKAYNGQLKDAIETLITAAIAALDTDPLAIARDMLGGGIIEWEAAVIPTLNDGLPLGLELDGSVVSLETFPRLLRKWAGAGTNGTVPAWYRCTVGGTRDAAGGYIKLQDRRGEFPRGWDHGRGVDTSRALGSSQAQSTSANGLSLYGRNDNGTAISGDGILTSTYQAVLFDAAANTASFGYVSTDKAGTPLIAGATETRGRNVATMFIVLV